MGVGWGHERRHGEHGGDAEGDAGRRGVAVEPEGNPGDDDNQTGRDVDLDQVVAHGADELDVARQTRVIPYFVKQQQQQSEIIHALRMGELVIKDSQKTDVRGFLPHLTSVVSRLDSALTFVFY